MGGFMVAKYWATLEEVRNTPVDGEVFSSSRKRRIRKSDYLRNVCRACALWPVLTSLSSSAGRTTEQRLRRGPGCRYSLQ